MRIVIVAVGHRQPAWVNEAFNDYARRMPHAARIELIEVKPEPRISGKTPMQLMQAEAQRIRAVLPQGAQLVTLDGKGKEFDSSYKRGEPIAFPLSRVVPCWTQGMQKIKVGGKDSTICLKIKVS